MTRSEESQGRTAPSSQRRGRAPAREDLGPTVAAAVRAGLAEKNLTVLAVARELGVSRGFIRRIVEGQPPPRLRAGRKTALKDDRYTKLAELLGLQVDAFIEQVVSEQRNERLSETQALEQAFNEAWCVIEGHLDSGQAADLLRAGQLAVAEVGRNQGHRLRDLIRQRFEVVALAVGTATGPRTASLVPTYTAAFAVPERDAQWEDLYRRLAAAVLSAGHATFEQRGQLASILYDLAARDVPPAALLEANKAR